MARVIEHCTRSRGSSGLEVGIGEHNVGALATQLERDSLDLIGAARHDALAHSGASGEANFANRGVLDEAPTNLGASANHHIEHTLGKPGLEGQLAKANGAQRRELRGLDDHGVAARQRRPNLPCRGQDRKVPGSDDTNDTKRLVEGHRDATRHRNGGASVLIDAAGVVVQHLGGGVGAPHAVADGHAHVHRVEATQFVGMLGDGVGETTDDFDAIERGHRPPRGQRRGSSRNGCIGIGGGGKWLIQDQRFGCRVDEGEGVRHRRQATSLPNGPAVLSLALGSLWRCSCGWTSK